MNKKITLNKRQKMGVAVLAVVVVAAFVWQFLLSGGDAPVPQPVQVPGTNQAAGTKPGQPPAGGQILADGNMLVPEPVITSDPFTPPLTYQKKYEQAMGQAPASQQPSGSNMNTPPITRSGNNNSLNNAVKPQTPVTPTLVGVMGNSDQKLILLRSGDKTKYVSVGESFGGYQVVSIDNDSATLSGYGSTKTLTMGK